MNVNKIIKFRTRVFFIRVVLFTIATRKCMKYGFNFRINKNALQHYFRITDQIQTFEKKKKTHYVP